MLDWSDRTLPRFDLHGQTVPEAAGNAERFLRVQAKVRHGGVVRLITGRGRAGGGAPIRTRVRSLLRDLQQRGEVVRDYLLEDSEGSFLVKAPLRGLTGQRVRRGPTRRARARPRD